MTEYIRITVGDVKTPKLEKVPSFNGASFETRERSQRIEAVCAPGGDGV